MGYDITFHSISKNELQRYVFDVLEDPSCAENRSKEISSAPEKCAKIFQTYYSDHLIKWFGEEQARRDDISPSFALVTAVIAGYLHPYHYSRNFALMLLSERFPEVKGLFTSLTKVQGSPLADYSDPNDGLISHNYAASGIVEHPSRVLDFIERNESELLMDYGEEEVKALKSCLNYCVERDLYFLEAAEVVFPLGGGCFSDYENLRASFLKQRSASDEAPSSDSTHVVTPNESHSSNARSAKPWWRFW